MTNRNGLHARPCALLDRALQPFNCTVQVVHDDASADAHSLFGLMSLAAGYQSELTFIITGHNAAKAMAAVARLFETNFEEAYPPQESRQSNHDDHAKPSANSKHNHENNA